MNQEFYLCTIDNHKYQYDDVTKNKDFIDSYIYIFKFEIIEEDIIEIKKIIYFADYYTGSRSNLYDNNKQLIRNNRRFKFDTKINLNDHNICGQIEHMRIIEYYNIKKDEWSIIPNENYFFNPEHVINICMKNITHLKYRPSLEAPASNDRYSLLRGPLLYELKETLDKYKNNDELIEIFKKQIDELFDKYI
jgi:hypothetical protein